MEQVKGIEPSRSPWEGDILPLNHTCMWDLFTYYIVALLCKINKGEANFLVMLILTPGLVLGGSTGFLYT